MHLDDQIDFKNKSLPNSLLLNLKKKKKFRVELNAHSYVLPQTY